ncbi:11-beta-hydroxysteroid dehydrogenase type 2 isoform X2 [Hemibagrus wyckioides]|uniref:11-beta-hydroxysteroid dehydrogenase type 2 isoform X2 n=1 Tax=Hemibagrus wyckioides TaxID=337641 RepID=UPI00266BE349|nr:11-beta-hydroxysteroid dehydrogenase type 2 isoform X2 [Hemibagrus wyckioides]
MDACALSFWIYMGVLSVFVGGTLKKFLASHVSAVPSLVAWLGATLLVERLCAMCMPAVLALAVFCATCWLYSLWSAPPPVLPVEGKAVFITGCDSGFGHATARRLDAMGFQVFATVLDADGEGAKRLRSSCSSRLTLLQVDITQPQQVQQALLNTKAKLGIKGLWALVNNAGVCVNFGDAELSLMSCYRGCMEVNFFGTLCVTKTFLPLLRQNKGRIVTISSPSGQSSNTEYWEKQHQCLLQNLSPSLLEEYGEDYVTETKDLFQKFAKSASEDLSPVVNTIVESLLAPQPRVRYYAGPGVGLMYFIYSYFPLSISDKFLQKIFLKKKVVPRALGKQNELNRINDNNNDIISNNNNISRIE